MNKNYYDILGVSKTATQDEIKKAFRELSKKYHPDRNGGDDTKFKEINEAYSILGDEQKRKEYDSPQQIPFMNGFHFTSMRHLASDIKVKINISIEDAYYGCVKQINTGYNILNVDIPKGTINGKILKIPGKGISGYNVYGQQAVGDLYITVGVIGNDNIWLNSSGLLETMCGVNWIDAILGTEMTINIFDREVKFRVPKYTQNGGFTIVSNQGFHKFKSDELDSLKVNFIVKMPKSLSDEHINLLKKIKEDL